MKTITVRDLRQRWPAAERLLQAERELIITRDGRPVARLVRVVADEPRRRRFEPTAHRRWQREVFGADTTVRWVEEDLAAGRSDRR